MKRNVLLHTYIPSVTMSHEQEEQTVEEPRRPHSPWSLQVGKVSGIPVRVHVTFLLLLLYIFLIGGKDLAMVLLMVLIFVCVVLHELGHALTAQKFGVQTRDITLYPIGGVAMLQGRPKASQEFWIALAGPAVNVLIALVITFISLAMRGRFATFLFGMGPNASIMDALFTANVMLPIFNMIPAFPMDGGRVLRAVLAMFLPQTTATQIAGGIGQFIAIIFGFAGLFQQNMLLMLVAFFVFMGANQEVQATIGLSFAEGKRVKDAMQTRFRTITSGSSLEEAAQMLLAGSQHDFPVVAGEEVIGVLSRTDIARGLAEEGPGAYVAGMMDRNVRRVPPDAPLESVFDMFSEGDNSPLVVMEGDALVGMLTTENLSEFIMLEHAKSRRPVRNRAT